MEFCNIVLVSKTTLQKELTAGNRVGQIYRMLLNWKLNIFFFSWSNVGSGAQLCEEKDFPTQSPLLQHNLNMALLSGTVGP